MKNIIHICVALLFLNTIKAQKKEQRLSLKEAITYALENSYAIKVAENDIKSAKKKKWETTTIGMPQIDGKVDYQNWLKQQVSLLPAEIFGGNPGEFAEVAFGTKQNLNTSVTLRQLIFDGAYIVGLQSSKTYLKISEQAKEKTKLGIREAVINAYGNVLVSEKSLSILKKNKINLEKNLQDAQKIYENGFNEEEDVEQLKITLGNLNSQLNNVKRMRQLAYKMLNITLGNSISTPLSLSDSLDSLIEKNIDLNLASQNFKIDDHIDFRIAQNDRESKRLLMKLEKTASLPNISAFINYGATANSNTFSFFNSQQRWFASSLFGVSINVPLFSSFKRKSKTAQAKIALESADVRLEEIKQKLNLQVESARNNYQFSIENYQTAQQNLTLAERIEKKQQIKFKEGVTTSFDLYQAQTQLYTQQQNYVQSMLDVIAKKAALENALNISIK